MVSIWVSLAILLVIIFVAVAVYFIVFHKHAGIQSSDPPGQGNTCIYDSDCPFTPDGVALRCINSQPPAGSSPAISGTCTAYCVQDSDCWNGNPTGQSPTCVTSATTGQSFCTLQPCSAQSDCSTGEGCLPLSAGATQNYCVVLGNNPKTTTYTSQSIPCSQNTCFGVPGINCLKGTGGATVGAPQWNFGPCIYNNDCSGGIPCSTGCYPSAASTTEGIAAGCPQPADKSSSTLSGTCGDLPTGFASPAWPVVDSGYCVQACTSDADCATGLTCDTSINACTSSS